MSDNLIGENIEKLIKARGMTKTEFSYAIDIRPTYLSKYLKGKQKPNVDTIVRIAEFFGVSTDFVLTGHTNAAKWISTKEELPECGEDVLVSWVDIYNVDCIGVSIGYMINNHWFISERENFRVLAWMPLPRAVSAY